MNEYKGSGVLYLKNILKVQNIIKQGRRERDQEASGGTRMSKCRAGGSPVGSVAIVTTSARPTTIGCYT